MLLLYLDSLVSEEEECTDRFKRCNFVLVGYMSFCLSGTVVVGCCERWQWIKELCDEVRQQAVTTCIWLSQGFHISLGRFIIFTSKDRCCFCERQRGNIKDNCLRQHFLFPEYFKQGSDWDKKILLASIKVIAMQYTLDDNEKLKYWYSLCNFF